MKLLIIICPFLFGFCYAKSQSDTLVDSVSIRNAWEYQHDNLNQNFTYDYAYDKTVKTIELKSIYKNDNSFAFDFWKDKRGIAKFDFDYLFEEASRIFIADQQLLNTMFEADQLRQNRIVSDTTIGCRIESYGMVYPNDYMKASYYIECGGKADAACDFEPLLSTNWNLLFDEQGNLVYNAFGNEILNISPNGLFLYAWDLNKLEIHNLKSSKVYELKLAQKPAYRIIYLSDFVIVAFCKNDDQIRFYAHNYKENYLSAVRTTDDVDRPIDTKRDGINICIDGDTKLQLFNPLNEGGRVSCMEERSVRKDGANSELRNGTTAVLRELKDLRARPKPIRLTGKGSGNRSLF